MYEVQKTIYRNLLTDRKNGIFTWPAIRQRLSAIDILSSIECSIDIGSRHFAIPDVMLCCWNAVQAEIVSLQNAGFMPFLFKLGATLTTEQSSTIPNERFLRSTISDVRAMIGEGPRIGHRFQIDSHFKSAALLPLSWSSLFSAVVLCNKHHTGVIILSRNEKFCSLATMTKMFPFVAIDVRNKLTSLPNEGYLSTLLCPSGDVIIKSYGQFDDLERDLEIIFDPRCHPGLSG